MASPQALYIVASVVVASLVAWVLFVRLTAKRSWKEPPAGDGAETR